MQWTLAKNLFYLDEKQSFYESLKTWNSYFLLVYRCRWSHDRHAQSCDVDSGTCDLRVELFHLFYFCEFSFVVHAKCSFPAFCMNYWIKFTKVKFPKDGSFCDKFGKSTQTKPKNARISGKSGFSGFLSMYVTTHSKPREDWCEWWTKMEANLNVFNTSKKDCISSKSN